MTEALFQSESRGIGVAINRKQAIIDAATKSFSLFGYKATTMDQVAKLALVGKGTIYTFFKNKEELFDEIVSTMIAEMKISAEDAIVKEHSFFENAHDALHNILEFRKQHQLMIKLTQENQEMGTPAVQEVLERVESEILCYIKEKIELAIEKQEIRECNPELTAFLLIKMYISLVFGWEKNHPPLSKEEIAQIIEQYFLKGLSN